MVPAHARLGIVRWDTEVPTLISVFKLYFREVRTTSAVWAQGTAIFPYPLRDSMMAMMTSFELSATRSLQDRRMADYFLLFSESPRLAIARLALTCFPTIQMHLQG